jgi:hypothetical protein
VGQAEYHGTSHGISHRVNGPLGMRVACNKDTKTSIPKRIRVIGEELNFAIGPSI